MVTSPTDICNLALGHLGEARITSLEEDSVAARACTLHYLNVRDEVLRSHRWNFAQDRKVLAALEDPPPFGWSRQYQLPVNCLRVLEVNGSEAGDVISTEYIVEGHKILTNSTEVCLVYIRQIDNVSDFDALFVRAFALKLAIILSETIRGTTQKTAELTQLYERITAPLARRVDANEGRRRKGLLAMNSITLRERGGAPVGIGGGGAVGIRGEPGPAGPAGPAGPPGDITAATNAAITTLQGVVRWTADLLFFGEASLNKIFDSYRPEVNARLTAVEINAQEAPSGGVLTIQVIDGSGNNVTSLTLAAGNNDVRAIVSPAFAVAANSTLRGKITAVGATAPSSWIRVRLSFQIAT